MYDANTGWEVGAEVISELMTRISAALGLAGHPVYLIQQQNQ